MKKKEIEKRLKKTITNSVPDCLDEILAKCEKKKGFIREVDEMRSERKLENKNSWFGTRLAWAVTVLIIGIVGLLGVNQYNKVYKTDSIVSFDVNPSIELKINKEKEIIKAIPLNVDGKKVLNEMDLAEVDLEVAINAIVGSMLKNGYITIDENSILVSVKNNDIDKANKLKEEISREINEILKASSISGSVLSQAYNNDTMAQKLADENDISEGKARLINNIIATKMTDRNGQLYTFDSLAKLSINELNLLLTAKETEIKDTNTSTQGTASESSYIGKEKAQNIAFKNAEVTTNKVTDLKIEMDADDGMLVYDVEFRVGKTEYEYEINAKTGEIVEKDIDNDDSNNEVKSNSANDTNNKSDNHYDDDDDDHDDDDD